jgi:hypothetical protein
VAPRHTFSNSNGPDPKSLTERRRARKMPEMAALAVLARRAMSHADHAARGSLYSHMFFHHAVQVTFRTRSAYIAEEPYDSFGGQHAVQTSCQPWAAARQRFCRQTFIEDICNMEAHRSAFGCERRIAPGTSYPHRPDACCRHVAHPRSQSHARPPTVSSFTSIIILSRSI